MHTQQDERDGWKVRKPANSDEKAERDNDSERSKEEQKKKTTKGRRTGKSGIRMKKVGKKEKITVGRCCLSVGNLFILSPLIAILPYL